MDLAARLYPRLAKAVARWGELGCDDLLVRSLHDELPPARAFPDLRLRLAGPADLDAIVDLYGAYPWLSLADYADDPGDPAQVRALYADRLRRGERCYLALSGDRIAHVNWCCQREGEVFPDQPLRLLPGEVYTTDALTTPAFRNRGIHGFVLRTMLADARDRGARRAYTLARVDNPETFKALSEVGFQRCGRVLYFLPKGTRRSHVLARRGYLEPLFRPAAA